MGGGGWVRVRVGGWEGVGGGYRGEGPGKYSGTVEGHLSRSGQDTTRQAYSSAQNVE